MPTSSSIKRKQLPAHSVSIEIYSGIARFPCDSMALVFTSGQSTEATLLSVGPFAAAAVYARHPPCAAFMEPQANSDPIKFIARPSGQSYGKQD